ncbi:MAG: glycosyltransferase family 1 protein [Gammaproteobacteria bacterium]|nr:glycosyltransferase family 1 protein [Gammaproteobacteria bacterium]
MTILIVTDAWHPQTNGVVTTLEQVIAGARDVGHRVEVLESSSFRTMGLPGYREIRVAINPFSVGRRIRELVPTAVHIATEGPLGLSARRFLVKQGLPFTTSLHTKFPEYMRARIGLPLRLGYRFLRWFHRPAGSTLVTTARQKEELEAWGLRHLQVWGRGVDIRRFRPRPRLRGFDGPLLLYVGRLAVEKNLQAFLELDCPGQKVVVGDGPQRAALQRRYPDVTFTGYCYGDELAEWYARADVFVFPSRTDTFGLVMLEAMACGTPVAAYPVTGPLDLVIEGVNGALDEDLGSAVERALNCDRVACRGSAEQQSWDSVVQRFLDDLLPIVWPEPASKGGVLAADRLDALPSETHR